LEKQNKFDMCHMRNLTDNLVASELIVEGKPWASFWTGPEEIIFGHDASRRIQRYSHATGIDSGCCYGGELTAYVLPSRKIISVKALKQYATTQPERLLGK